MNDVEKDRDLYYELIMGYKAEKEQIDERTSMRKTMAYIEERLDNLYSLKSSLNEQFELDKYGEVREIEEIFNYFLELNKKLYEIGFSYGYEYHQLRE